MHRILLKSCAKFKGLSQNKHTIAVTTNVKKNTINITPEAAPHFIITTLPFTPKVPHTLNSKSLD